MTGPWVDRLSPLDALTLIEVLGRHEVRYVVVGGIAALAHGFSGATADLDAVPSTDRRNLDRLAAALAELGAKLYADPRRTDLRDDGSPPEAEGFELNGEHLRSRLDWHFSTSAGRLDVLLVIDGPGGYDVLARSAEKRTVGDTEVLVASLDDLVEAKETAGRAKDLRVLAELREIRDARRGPR